MSREAVDWDCPRKRYYQYNYDGKGIVTDTSSLELVLGTIVHDGLATIARGVTDIDEIARIAKNLMYEHLIKETDDIDFSNEQATLVEGMLRGFYKHAWPRLQ